MLRKFAFIYRFSSWCCRVFTWLSFGYFGFFSTGCKKFVQVSAPIGSLDGTTVYSNNSTAAAAVTYVYENMMASASISSGSSGLSILSGLQADELVNYVPANTNYEQFYVNALTSANGTFWSELYQYIYVANAAIQGLANSPDVTSTLSQQLTGESRFIRAFMLFYLANLYGAVPMPMTPAYQTNELLYRKAQDSVMEQVISDLQVAQGLLTQGYLSASNAPTSERTRPNKAAATALLARAYLYIKDWKDAESQATTVISDNTDYNLVPNPDSVFLANSREAIWQLQPVQPGYNTFDAFYLILTGAPNSNQSSGLSPFLLETFEAGDNRMADWVGRVTAGGITYYYPYKYKVGAYAQPVTEYLMVLRLAEQYLIRAEARAEQQNIIGAITDLNVIRSRAGLAPYSGPTDQASVLAAILHERQVELFTEWGHRWLDLERTGNLTAVMDSVETVKGGSWNPEKQLYPIPATELTLNPNLKQNPGY